MHRVSLIITTYNRPVALSLVLHALAAQTVIMTAKNSRTSIFEVIIADDGSTLETTQVIEQLREELPYPLKHVWQTDNGFRAAMARNRAIAVAEGEYCIFLDGDCIPLSDFVEKQCILSEKQWFVAGNRVLLSKRLTEELEQRFFSESRNFPIWQWRWKQWIRYYFSRDINRLTPLFHLPLGALRKHFPQQWQGAKTCNLAVWRDDFLRINGFNESFEGWGHEDAELVVRLLRSGIKRKEGRFAVPVLHLWHPEQSRTQERLNYQRLEETLYSTCLYAEKGVNQHRQS